MFIGLDKQNNRVTAAKAIHGNEYHCPICEEKLELRQGDIRMHHFAHWKNRSCTDTWSSDMSEWHINWQAQFPEECQEVVVEFDGKKHRADVLIEESKLVVEFQHSPLSPREFAERNDFYTRSGYHVIWLFDMTKGFDDEHFILSNDGDCYSWKHAWGTFAPAEYDCINYSGDWNYSPDIDKQARIEGIHFNRRVLNEDVSVFFQDHNRILKLLYYDIENKKIVTSINRKDNPFVWSPYTFQLFLVKTFRHLTLYAPSCSKCKEKMVLREYSQFGGFLWGCVNFMVANKDCRERINIGALPARVTFDNKCPFCNEDLVGSVQRVRCRDCGYEIEIITQ